MNILSKIFSTNTEKNENENDNPTSEGNCIIFSLDQKSNDEPFIKIKIQNISTNDSIKFAQLLYDITGGLYNDSIINLMLKMTEQDLHIRQFINSTILNWGLLSKDYNRSNTDNQPVIMPTDFNKNAK